MEMGVLRVRDIIRRAVEIHLLIVVPVEVLLDVERTAHTEEVRDLLRMPKRKIQGVVAAKAAARHPDFVHVTFRTDAGHELFVQHAVVERVVIDSLPGVQVLGIPTVHVNAVNTVQLDFPRLHKVPGRLHELEVLVLVVPAHRRGKQDKRIAPVAKDQVFDIAA